MAHLFLKKIAQFEALVERQLTKTKEDGSVGKESGSVGGENDAAAEEEVIDVSLWEEDEQSSGGGSGGSGGRRQSLARALVAQLAVGGQEGGKGTN